MTQYRWWLAVSILTLAFGFNTAGAQYSPQSATEPCQAPQISYPVCPPACCKDAGAGTAAPGGSAPAIGDHCFVCPPATMTGTCSGMYTELRRIFNELHDNQIVLRKARSMEIRDVHGKLIWRKDVGMPEQANGVTLTSGQTGIGGGFRVISGARFQGVSAVPPAPAASGPCQAVFVPVQQAVPCPPMMVTPPFCGPVPMPVPPTPPPPYEVIVPPHHLPPPPPPPPPVQYIAEAPRQPAKMWVVAKGDEGHLEIQCNDNTCATCKELVLKGTNGSSVKLSLADKQVQISGSFFEAKADRLSCSLEGNRVILQGHVCLKYNKDGQHAKVIADHVVINVADGSLEIKAKAAPAENATKASETGCGIGCGIRLLRISK